MTHGLLRDHRPTVLAAMPGLEADVFPHIHVLSAHLLAASLSKDLQAYADRDLVAVTRMVLACLSTE